jgi:outer membrane protein assembly factor BamA
MKTYTAVLSWLVVLSASTTLCGAVGAVWADIGVTATRATATPDSITTKPDGNTPHTTALKAFPYIYYTPETELAAGVGGILTFYTGPDSILHPSNMGISGYYSTNGQYNISLTPKLYYSRNDVYASASVNLGHIVDKFFGIGNETPDLGDESYVTDRYGAEFTFEIPPVVFEMGLRSGLVYKLQYNDIADVEQNPYLQNDSIPGSTGGTISGLGLIWVWDSRNQTFYPTAGALGKIKFVTYSSWLGSDYPYVTLVVDERRYLSLSKNQVLAFQAYVSIASGVAPFYELPALGGQNRMRGYYEGRYRDNVYLTSQIEFRQHVWGRWGFVVFGAVGDVAAEMIDFRLDQLKLAGGAGLRWMLNKEQKVNVRMDMGFGKDTNGVYFGVEEAF